MYKIGLCDNSITSFIAIFSLLSQYDLFLFVITIIATCYCIVKVQVRSKSSILLVPLDLPIYLPSKEAVKKTVPTYVHSTVVYNGAILWFYCYRNKIEYRYNLVKILWNIVIMLFLLSHRPSTKGSYILLYMYLFVRMYVFTVNLVCVLRICTVIATIDKTSEINYALLQAPIFTSTYISTDHKVYVRMCVYI